MRDIILLPIPASCWEEKTGKPGFMDVALPINLLRPHWLCIGWGLNHLVLSTAKVSIESNPYIRCLRGIVDKLHTDTLD